MSDNVIATLVVPFGGSAKSASGNIMAEWDDTMNLDQDGNAKSQWQPGDEAFLIVHHDHTAEIVDVRATAGNIATGQVVSLPREELVGFPQALEQQALQYLPESPPEVTWQGNSGREWKVSGREMVVSAGDFPCLAHCLYQVRFIRYRLKTPTMTLKADETFPIRVYVYYRELST